MEKVELTKIEWSVVKTALHNYKDLMKELIQKTDEPYPFEMYGITTQILNEIKTQTT